MTTIASFTTDRGAHLFNATTFCDNLIAAGCATANQALAIRAVLRKHAANWISVVKIDRIGAGPFRLTILKTNGDNWQATIGRNGAEGYHTLMDY